MKGANWRSLLRIIIVGLFLINGIGALKTIEPELTLATGDDRSIDMGGRVETKRRGEENPLLLGTPMPEATQNPYGKCKGAAALIDELQLIEPINSTLYDMLGWAWFTIGVYNYGKWIGGGGGILDPVSPHILEGLCLLMPWYGMKEQDELCRSYFLEEPRDLGGEDHRVSLLYAGCPGVIDVKILMSLVKSILDKLHEGALDGNLLKASLSKLPARNDKSGDAIDKWDAFVRGISDTEDEWGPSMDEEMRKIGEHIGDASAQYIEKSYLPIKEEEERRRYGWMNGGGGGGGGVSNGRHANANTFSNPQWGNHLGFSAMFGNIGTQKYNKMTHLSQAQSNQLNHPSEQLTEWINNILCPDEDEQNIKGFLYAVSSCNTVSGQWKEPYLRIWRLMCYSHTSCYLCGNGTGDAGGQNDWFNGGAWNAKWTREQCDDGYRSRGEELCRGRYGHTGWNMQRLYDCYDAVSASYSELRQNGLLNYAKDAPYWCRGTCANNLGNPKGDVETFDPSWMSQPRLGFALNVPGGDNLITSQAQPEVQTVYPNTFGELVNLGK